MLKQVFSFVFCVLGLFLSACSSGTSSNQNALTNAQLVTPAASCNQIVQNIQAMDNIIMQTQGGSGANYGHVASQTVNTGLNATGAFYKVPGIGGLASTVTSLGSSGQGNQLKYQQGYQAQSEKQRLISLFQQKKCVRVQ